MAQGSKPGFRTAGLLVLLLSVLAAPILVGSAAGRSVPPGRQGRRQISTTGPARPTAVPCRLVCETTVDLRRPCGSKPVAISITKCKLVYETRVDQEKPCVSKPGARSITSTERATRISCKTLQIRLLSVILPAPSLLPQGFSWVDMVSHTTGPSSQSQYRADWCVKPPSTYGGLVAVSLSQ